MRYKTNDIGENGITVDLALDATWLSQTCPEFEGTLGPKGLRLLGRIERTGDDFLLRGKLQGNIATQCTRCLEATAVDVDVDIAVQFIETDPNLVDADPEGGGDFVRFDNGLIDLTDEIREEIFLAVPMSPRCEPECLGICPHCGCNRDKHPCDCEERQRLAASPFRDLAKFKS